LTPIDRLPHLVVHSLWVYESVVAPSDPHKRRSRSLGAFRQAPVDRVLRYRLAKQAFDRRLHFGPTHRPTSRRQHLDDGSLDDTIALLAHERLGRDRPGSLCTLPRKAMREGIKDSLKS
jgi:hypothetical protein